MTDTQVRFKSASAEFTLPLMKADSLLRHMRGDNASTTQALMLVLRGEPQTFKFKSQFVSCELVPEAPAKHPCGESYHPRHPADCYYCRLALDNQLKREVAARTGA